MMILDSGLRFWGHPVCALHCIMVYGTCGTVPWIQLLFHFEIAFVCTETWLGIITVKNQLYPLSLNATDSFSTLH